MQWVLLMSSISRITNLLYRDTNAKDMAQGVTILIQNLADTEASTFPLSSESAVACLGEIVIMFHYVPHIHDSCACGLPALCVERITIVLENKPFLSALTPLHVSSLKCVSLMSPTSSLGNFTGKNEQKKFNMKTIYLEVRLWR